MLRRILAFSLSLVLLLSSNLLQVHAIIPGEDTVSGQFPSNIDMSLSAEKQLAKYIFSEFQITGLNNSECEFIQNPNNVEEYIPYGAICTELSIFEDVIIIDYRISNVRYLVSYYRDGHVEKIARELESDIMYTIDDLSMIVVGQDRNENRVTIEYATFDEDAVPQVDESSNATVSSNNLSMDAVTWSTAIEVDPLSYTECPSTAPYKARIVKSGLVMIDAFVDLGYGTLQDYRIYETMYYHSEVKKTTIAFSVGTTLAKIATAFAVPVSTAKAWLTVASVALSTAGIIQDACKIIDEHAYTYLGSKECAIYDVTKWNTFVETYQVNDSGKIVLTWSYDSDTGYNTPTWGHSKRSQALLMDNSDVLAEGKWSYNAQIYQFGFWHTGVGNGFGY